MFHPAVSRRKAWVSAIAFAKTLLTFHLFQKTFLKTATAFKTGPLFTPLPGRESTAFDRDLLFKKKKDQTMFHENFIYIEKEMTSSSDTEDEI